MAVELRNVPGDPEPQGYTHVSIATGSRIIHVAGRTGTKPDGELPEGLAAQAEQALLSVGRTLEAAGASASDLVKLTIYVVDWHPAKYEELGAGLLAAVTALSAPPAPVTMIGVQTLFEPGMLVEIEGVAVAN